MSTLPSDAQITATQNTAMIVAPMARPIGDEGSRDCDALTLTTGQAAAALADDRVVALGELEDELMGPCEGRRSDDLLHRHGRIGQRDVVPHRAIEQQVLLEHHAKLSAQ